MAVKVGQFFLIIAIQMNLVLISIVKGEKATKIYLNPLS